MAEPPRRGRPGLGERQSPRWHRLRNRPLPERSIPDRKTPPVRFSGGSFRPSGEQRMINDLWYKNAIIYCLSVGSYMDANGDGIGDFTGLMRRLDYLHGLGITAIWLMPFQVSPHRDDGYDVSDYYGVDPRYGTIGDFVEFTHGAKPRPATAQWGTFLRNHDELDLGRLTERQRQKVFAAFAPQPQMQLYQRGI